MLKEGGFQGEEERQAGSASLEKVGESMKR